jgi:hypothetical protein
VLDCGVNDQFAACEIADAGINLAHHLSLKRAIITDEPVHDCDARPARYDCEQAVRTPSASHRVSSGSFIVSRVVPVYLLIYSRLQMLDRTETLKVGSRAPEFALEAANREGVLTLSGFLRRGMLIAEFLRGTW